MHRGHLLVAAALLAVSAGLALAHEPEPPPNYDAIITAVTPSLVRVEFALQFDRGEAPKQRSDLDGWGQWASYFDVSDAGDLVKQERPLEIGGYCLSPTRVVTADPLIHPRFIKGISVRFHETVVSARPASYASSGNALMLELSEPLKDATPLEFKKDLAGPYHQVAYGVEKGLWTVGVASVDPSLQVTETNRRFRSVKPHALIVDRGGRALGLTASDTIPADDSWKGSPLEWPAVSHAEMAGLLDRLEKSAASAILRVGLSFRSPKAGGRQHIYSSGDDAESGTERNVLGILLSDRRVLVLANLKPKVTARLERIVVHSPDGPAPAKFAGSLWDFGCFLADLDKPLTGAVTVGGGDPRDQRFRLMLLAEVLMQGEKRVAWFTHARTNDVELKWERQPYPQILGGAENVFLFDTQGALAALPIERRVRTSSAEESWQDQGVTLTPAAYVAAAIADLKQNSDPSNVPLSEEEENRLAWLGVELQPLDQELARANDVSDRTNDGQSGAMVSHVYAGSPAADKGIQQGDILLRVHVQGEPKPLDVRIEDDGFSMDAFPWDRLDEVPEEYFDQIPRPWPSAENTFTRALTDFGFDKTYSAEVFRGGKVMSIEFPIAQSPAHYDSAPRFKSESLGLTVRNVTYEVRRYFQMQDADPGVIVSKIEQGGKAAVAGVKPYEIVTHVNDKPVSDAKVFESLIAGSGEDLRLNVKRMTRGRLVKIKAPKAADKPPGGSGP